MATSAVRSEIWRPETPFFSALQSQVAVPRASRDSAWIRRWSGLMLVMSSTGQLTSIRPMFSFFFIFLFAAVLVPGEARQDLRTGVVRLLRCEINRINQMGWYSVRSTCSNKHHHHYQQQMRNSLNVKKCLFLYSLFG
ncbi:hypothetical protein HDV62DRAFT_278605 [Trichoderma sp. SZMC 28011]